MSYVYHQKFGSQQKPQYEEMKKGLDDSIEHLDEY